MILDGDPRQVLAPGAVGLEVARRAQREPARRRGREISADLLDALEVLATGWEEWSAIREWERDIVNELKRHRAGMLNPPETFESAAGLDLRTRQLVKALVRRLDRARANFEEKEVDE